MLGLYIKNNIWENKVLVSFVNKKDHSVKEECYANYERKVNRLIMIK